MVFITAEQLASVRATRNRNTRLREARRADEAGAEAPRRGRPFSAGSNRNLLGSIPVVHELTGRCQRALTLRRQCANTGLLGDGLCLTCWDSRCMAGGHQLRESRVLACSLCRVAHEAHMAAFRNRIPTCAVRSVSVLK